MWASGRRRDRVQFLLDGTGNVLPWRELAYPRLETSLLPSTDNERAVLCRTQENDSRASKNMARLNCHLIALINRVLKPCLTAFDVDHNAIGEETGCISTLPNEIVKGVPRINPTHFNVRIARL